MAETKYEARLKTLYNETVAKELKDELKLNNINEVPKLDKVIVSSGVGKKREDNRDSRTYFDQDHWPSSHKPQSQKIYRSV